MTKTLPTSLLVSAGLRWEVESLGVSGMPGEAQVVYAPLVLLVLVGRGEGIERHEVTELPGEALAFHESLSLPQTEGADALDVFSRAFKSLLGNRAPYGI